MSNYRKAILGALGAAATWLGTASLDGQFTRPELFGLLAAVVTAGSVYYVRNEPENSGTFLNGDGSPVPYGS